MTTSILSREPDGLGFYYGFAKPDMRQINLRYEWVINDTGFNEYRWVVYVGGEQIATCETFPEGEETALWWIKMHPDDDE